MKNNLLQIARCVRAESIKSKKTLALLSTIFVPLFIVGLNFFIFFFRSNDFAAMTNNWKTFVGNNISIAAFFLLPFYINILAYSLNTVEHKTNTWKHLFALPISRITIYFSKIIYGFFLLFLFTSFFVLFIYGAGYSLTLLKPELQMQIYSSKYFILTLISFLKIFCASLSIFGIQFFLSIYWKEFMKPIGFGFLGVISAFMISSWRYSYFFPYSQAISVAQDFYLENSNFLQAGVILSIGYFFVISLLGSIIINKKNV